MASSSVNFDDRHPGSAGNGDTGWTPKVLVSLLSMCLLLNVLAMFFLFMTIALPSIARYYDTTQAAWLLTGFMLAGAVTAPLFGKFADIHGKRKVLMVCALIAAAGALLGAVTPNFVLLVLGCVLIGALTPCVFLVYTLINDVFPKSTVVMAVSVTTSSMGLGAVYAPFIAGWLLESYGFHSLFWFILACLSTALVLVRLTTAESPHRQHARPDLIGAVLLGAAIAGILLGLSEGPTAGWAAPKTLLCFIGGAVLFVAWIISARSVKEPLVDIRHLASRKVNVIVFTAGFAFSAGAVYMIVLPFMAMTSGQLGLGYGFGVSAFDFAFIQAPSGVAVIIGGIIAGWALKRIGLRVGLLLSFTILAVAAVLTALFHDSKAVVIALVVFQGLGTGIAYACVPNLVLTYIEQSLQATIGSLATVLQTLVPAVMSIVTFVVLNSFIAMEVQGNVVYSDVGITNGFLLSAVVSALGFVVILLLPRGAGQEADG